ncbi:hypothetical protein E2320_007679, partial [Naja naja]
SLDGGKTFGTIDVRFINMGKTEDGESNQITTDGKEQKIKTQCALVYSCSSPENIINKDNLPLLNAVLKNPICKLYTFPTSDNKWMYIREQMFESNLSFHVPKELINLHIKEDLKRNQDLKELGELSPHWDNMRKNVIAHCDQMLILYQNMLSELGKYTGQKMFNN